MDAAVYCRVAGFACSASGFPQISAIDRQPCDGGAKGLVQVVTRVIAMARMTLADFEEKRGQAIEIAAKDLAHHEILLRQGDAGEVGRLTGELRVKACERPFARRIDQQPTYGIHEVVSGGAGDRP